MNGELTVNVRTDVLLAMAHVVEKALDELAAARQERDRLMEAMARRWGDLQKYREMPSYSFVDEYGTKQQVYGHKESIAALARKDQKSTP